jgi:hypothetical protein
VKSGSGESSAVFIGILWALVVVGLIAIFGCWLAFSFSNAQLRGFLARWTVLWLDLCILCVAVGVVASWRLLRELFGSISRSCWCGLCIVLAIGVFLVGPVAQRTNRIFYDEHIYQNIAQSITFTGEALMCNEGEAEFGEYRPFITEYNKQPNGHPYYLSLFFRAFGISERVAHIANNIAYLGGIAGVFLLAFLLFDSPQTGLLASACFALTPMVVIWSDTAAAEPAAACFTVLGLLAAAVYVRKPCASTVLLAAGLCAFSACFRPESALFLLPSAAMVLTGRPAEFRKPRLYWLSALLAALLLPEILHVYAVGGEGWGSGGNKFMLSVLPDNLAVNGLFFFRNIRYPVVFSLLALVGLAFGGTWQSKATVVAWFAYSWGIFLVFYAGSFNYGADVRFSVLSAAPLAILAGHGASVVSRRIGSLSLPAPTAVLITVVVLLWVKFLPLLRAEGSEAADARLDVQYAREMAEYVPIDSIVLTHNPSMWLLWGKDAAQMSIATNNRTHVERDYFSRYRGGVYLHWNFWCNVQDPVQNRFAKNVIRDFDSVLVAERDARGFRYALYRLYPKGRGPVAVGHPNSPARETAPSESRGER